jgi:hypothetical protein
MMRTTVSLLSGGLFALALAAAPADAATIWALDTAGSLARIDTDSRQAMPARKVTGADGAVIAIALRPADGKLYGLTATHQLVTIDPATARATQVAKLDKSLDGAARIVINFNPTVDRLRILSSNGGNWRVHPDTGAVIIDGALKYAPDSAYADAKPTVTAGAYTNHFAGTKQTALYTLDTRLGLYNLQSPPNDGTQQPKGRPAVALPANAGFDILADGKGGNAGFIVAAGMLHGIDLATGQLTPMGRVTGLSGQDIVAIAVEK